MNAQIRSAVIATCIEYFNIILIIALAAFASWGVIAVLSKKLRGRLPLLSAFGVAALAAFALEATAFNFGYYLKYFSGAPTEIAGMSETDSNTLTTSDGTKAGFVEGVIIFNGLNRNVTSVYIDMEYDDDIEVRKALIVWTDEAITQQSYVRQFYKYLPHENYVPIQPCGKVSDLNVAFVRTDSTFITFNKFAINEPIPFYFSGLRLLVVSLLLFVPLALANKKLRAKAAYYLFEYRFDPKNKKQNVVYACTVALLLVFSWVCVYTSVPQDADGIFRLQYNRLLVDALIAGRTHLNYGNPGKLLNMERPYDGPWRNMHGYNKSPDNIPKDVLDWAWYKGKYYCYFGVVPAALLYVPYKMITGKYLSDHVALFLFCAAAVILLAALWRYCVKKYMPDTRYAFYLLSFVACFFTSGLLYALKQPSHYLVVQGAGFMFTAAGVLLLLKSVDNEKIHYLKLFFACLCLALVFGCRPSMGPVSLLVPVILWKRRTWKLAAFALLPYAIVAVPLCWYNYVRFESIFEFGIKYNLTGFYIGALSRQTVIGKIVRVFACSALYLFNPARFSLHFPFIEVTKIALRNDLNVSSGVMYNYQDIIGIVNFPIVFLLFYMFKNIFNKNKPETFYILSASLIIAASILFLISMGGGVSTRYMLDFQICIILPSLFCAYYWSQDRLNGDEGGGATRLLSTRARLYVTYGLMTASILVGLFAPVSLKYAHLNPTLYRYLETSLGVFGNV